MRRHSRIFTAPVAAALLLSATATGCFTGVESTPRITDAEVRRDVPPPTTDERYLEGIGHDPVSQWQAGKRFYITAPRISLAITPDIFGGDTPGTADTLVYTGMSPARSLTGQEVTDLHFTGPGGKGYTYRVDREPDSVAARSLEIPFTIDLDLVERSSERLLGRKFYIVSSARRTPDGTFVRSRKYVPVTVESVGAGTVSNPVRLSIVDDRGIKGLLYIDPTVRNARSAGSFASVLSLNDPRKRYPSITDEVWQNIVNNRVAPGMTRDECRLALGSPSDVLQQPGYGYLHEAWRYDNGTYLIFEDGILVRR